jgi:L-rhamnose isomerase
MTKENIIRQAYEAAVERYAAVGVDVREAMDKLQKISLSMHCWQAELSCWWYSGSATASAMQ